MSVLASVALTAGGKPKVLGIDAEVEGDMVTCSFLHIEEPLDVGPNEFMLYVDENGPGEPVAIDWFGLPAAPSKKTMLPGGRVTLPIVKEDVDEQEENND